MADGREPSGPVLTKDTESYQLNLKWCELQSLKLNGERLTWTNNLESLKNFVENGLKLQGKWSSPGGNVKQFKSSNNNLVINWYNKKQLTLCFQGRDGPSLKDKLVKFIQNKQGTEADTPVSYASTTEQEIPPSQEANGICSNRLASAADAELENSIQERSNSVISADIEGLKLDLLILQKKVEANTSLLSTKCKLQETAFSAELLDYKERYEKVLSTLSKKDNEIEVLEEKCFSYESQVLSLQQENDSLKLAMKIIMQERSEGECRQQKICDCWSQVGTLGKSVNDKHIQRPLAACNIVTQNRFEPLRSEVQFQVRNEDNYTANNEESRQQQQQQHSHVDSSEASRAFDSIPTSHNRYQALLVSSPSSQVSSEMPLHQSGAHANTSRVSANNSKSGEVGKTRPIVLIGDSMIKHIDPKKLSQRHVHKFSYPGKTTAEIAEAVDNIAVASADPSHVIIHTGTNNLPSESADSCVADIKNLVLKVKSKFPNSSIGLSGIVYREDINVDAKRIEVNERVKLTAVDNNFTYIDNSVIDASALNGSRLHLNAKGSSLLAVQFIKFLRSGSGKYNQSLKGFQSSAIQQLVKLLMELGNLPSPARNRRRPR